MMANLNNKGQSLVMFILLIPIMCLVMVLVIDIGNLYCEKKEVDSIGYLVCDYGLSHYNDDNVLNNMVKLAGLNNNKLSEVSVNIKDNNVDVIIGEDVNGMLGKLFDFNIFSVNVHYSCNIESGNIERIK